MAAATDPSPRTHDHRVCVYREPGQLAGSAAAFLADGFALGEPAVVIATAENVPRFAAALRERGWDPADLEPAGLLTLLDADETLEAILVDGAPSPAAFERIVGAVLDAAERPDRGLRAFGEMVDLLCLRGDTTGAAALEELWNRLLAERAFSLLCAYRIDVLDRGAQVALLPQVCESHSHVQTADSDRLQDAVHGALVDTLGAGDAAKVYGMVAPQMREGRIPTAQLLLMWLSAQMPRSAERIVALARERYAQAAAAS